MKMTSMGLFQLLKTKTGEREAGAHIDFMDNKIHDSNHELQEMCLKTFATKVEFKDEIIKVREEIGKVREDLVRVESRLETKIAEVEGRLEVKIVEVKSDVIRWMFGFFVAMLIAILGLYLRK
jgi:dihydroxyacetone kinase-like predicted kinase